MSTSGDGIEVPNDNKDGSSDNVAPYDIEDAEKKDENQKEEQASDPNVNPLSSSDSNIVTSNHALKSTLKGGSACEQLASRIETRRANRIPITQQVRMTLLETCTKIAEDKGYESTSKIDIEDLVTLRDQFKEKQANKKKGMEVLGKFYRYVGFHDNDMKMLEVLEKAVTVVREIQMDDDDWFYFRDFLFYYVQVVSRWPWMRNELRVAFCIVFLFYLFTPIFFCHIVDDKDVCPDDPVSNRSYYGWMTSLYFASATMSTVGYGDVSVQQDKSWRVFMGILYMIIAMLVAINAFGAAADAASGPLDGVRDKLLDLIPGYKQVRDTRDLPLPSRIRRIKFIKMMEITLQFTFVNLLGFFVSRAFVPFRDDPTDEEDTWTWMQSLYWAVQTTTTIGYGDLTIPFDMRWFNIFYLAMATYFVGNALGKLASLKQELDDVRRYYAWERREVSKGMIEEFQGDDHDDVVDQYEFLVASLLTLGKLSSSDIGPVLDKYRELAGKKGYIKVSEDMVRDDHEPVDTADFTLPMDK